MTEKEILEEIQKLNEAGEKVLKYFSTEMNYVKSIRWDVANLAGQRDKLRKENEEIVEQTKKLHVNMENERQEILANAGEVLKVAQDRAVEALKLLDDIKEFADKVDRVKYDEMKTKAEKIKNTREPESKKAKKELVELAGANKR